MQSDSDEDRSITVDTIKGKKKKLQRRRHKKKATVDKVYPLPPQTSQPLIEIDYITQPDTGLTDPRFAEFSRIFDYFSLDTSSHDQQEQPQEQDTPSCLLYTSRCV